MLAALRIKLTAQTSKESQSDITHPLCSHGCLWKLRIINGFYHHSHQPLHNAPVIFNRASAEPKITRH